MAKKGSFLDVVKGLTQKKGGKDKEVEKYEKILQEHLDDRNALNALGDLYAKRNETGKACEYYLKVGELYAKDGFTLKAIAVYKKAQRAKPEIIKTYLDLADLYVQKGLIGEAKTNYLAAAEMQAAAGNKHDSLDTYRKIADLDPTNIKIRTKLAAMYESENFIEDAAVIYSDIGDVVIRKNLEEGQKYYDRALQLQAENEEILSRIGYSYTDLGLKEHAAKLFDSLVRMFPGNIDYKEQLEELTSGARAPEVALEEASIQFSEEELSSLNFGDETGATEPTLESHVLDFQIGEDGLTGLAEEEPRAAAIEEHTLDFAIADQGAISWQDEHEPKPESPEPPHETLSYGPDFHLDVEVFAEPAQETAAVPASEFFDLAGRLDTAAKQPKGLSPWGQRPPQPEPGVRIERSEQLALSEIDDIVKEFKQGVLEEVGTEDYETHYELGISYKEMSLLDDAIEELKLAALEPSKFVECQGIIALCYLEKGETALAVQAYQEARRRVEPQSGKYQDLTYQIASIYEEEEKITEAAQVYQELFQINPNYRDVKRRLKRLLG
ncbi:TPR domain protein [Candidatus Vecturithrix granuli]|uniref:TPR domain protein n=1 Tax=Vecturithrix granuli TaxID=1499967 RepID=A0A081C769_VECG1|nr:TPR domain protein [Candidatus Vecturithrix granuli]